MKRNRSHRVSIMGHLQWWSCQFSRVFYAHVELCRVIILRKALVWRVLTFPRTLQLCLCISDWGHFTFSLAYYFINKIGWLWNWTALRKAWIHCSKFFFFFSSPYIVLVSASITVMSHMLLVIQSWNLGVLRFWFLLFGQTNASFKFQKKISSTKTQMKTWSWDGAKHENTNKAEHFCGCLKLGKLVLPC